MTKKDDVNMDWDALERCWAEQYEDDYESYFSDAHCNRNIRVHISPIVDAGIAAAALRN